MVGLDTSVLVHLEIKEAPEHSRAHDWLRRVILDGRKTIALALVGYPPVFRPEGALLE